MFSWLGALGGLVLGFGAVLGVAVLKRRKARQAAQHGVAPGARRTAGASPETHAQIRDQVARLLAVPTSHDAEADQAKRLAALHRVQEIAAQSQDGFLAASIGLTDWLRTQYPNPPPAVFAGPPEDVAPWAARLQTDPVVQKALSILSWPNDEWRKGVVYDKRHSRKQSGHDLRGMTLQGADMAGLDLRNCAFDEAALDGTTLTGARLDLATFRKASLVGANLRGAKASLAVFNQARLTGACLAEAALDSASFNETAARLADFSSADLTGAALHNADLHRARFVKARLNTVDLHGTCLDQTDLTEADLSEADIIAAEFSATTLDGASLIGAEILLATFEETALTTADLQGAGIAHTDLRGTGLTKAQAATLFVERDTVYLDAGLVPHPDSPQETDLHFKNAHQSWRAKSPP